MKPSPLPNPVKALGLVEGADIDELLIRNDRAEGFPRAGETEGVFDLEDMSFSLPLKAKVASTAVGVDRSDLGRGHRRAGIRHDP